MEADDIRTPSLRAENANIDDAILEEQTQISSSAPLDPADFEDFFTRRLDSHYSSNREEYRLDQTESTKLRARLREANTSFLKSRRTDTSLEERERALQKLETGYLKFLEIAQNLDEGRKFYNELAKMLGRWREEIRGFVYQRKKEARDLESSVGDVVGEMAKMKISDGRGEKSPVQQERRTSQRITRSTKGENKPEDINTDGNPSSPGMWTPGIDTVMFNTNLCF
jgi:programmed cell death 6-interacting protein